MKDPFDDRDFLGVAADQGDPLVLNPLALAGVEGMQRLPFLIQQQPLGGVGRWPACPVALLGDLAAPPPDLVAQLATVLRRAKSLELDVDRIERVFLA